MLMFRFAAKEQHIINYDAGEVKHLDAAMCDKIVMFILINVPKITSLNLVPKTTITTPAKPQISNVRSRSLAKWAVTVRWLYS
jgi:hypothetical protein